MPNTPIIRHQQHRRRHLIPYIQDIIIYREIDYLRGKTNRWKLLYTWEIFITGNTRSASYERRTLPVRIQKMSLWIPLPCTHVYIHIIYISYMHTYLYLCMHTYIHTYIMYIMHYIFACIYIVNPSAIHTYTYIHTLFILCIIHIYTYACTHIYMHKL